MSRVVSRQEAVRVLGDIGLYDEAREWALGDVAHGTPLNLYRALDPIVSRRLRFRAYGEKPKGLFFKTHGRLSEQALRGVRQLRPDSADLLEQIIARTDQWPRKRQVRLVRAMLLDE